MKIASVLMTLLATLLVAVLGVAGTAVAVASAWIVLSFGDSFNAGAPKVGPPNVLGCQRQEVYSADIVARELGMGSRNVACAGATVAQMMSGWKGESSQLDAITDDVKVILVSAGGNDAIGPTTTAACMVPIECTADNPVIKKGFAGIASLWNPATKTGVLGDLYSEIASRTSATVLIEGYPVRIAAADGRVESFGCQLISVNERKLANRLVAELNTALLQAAEYYGFTYVDPFEPGWFNDGEDICACSPNKLVVAAEGPIPGHPNGRGVERRAKHDLAKLTA